MGPGKQFADYEIIEEIARGGMGVVYKARHRITKNIIALKMLLAGPQATRGQIKRFLREAKAITRLKHPHIIPIYNMGEENAYHYFAMKYIEGTTFHDLIDNDSISLSEKLMVISKVCKALHHAHRRGILHRDIKPSNILIDSTGEPFLTDFGLAKAIDKNLDLSQTGVSNSPSQAKNVIGTPFYMAPEQVSTQSHRWKPDLRTDIYSMGVVLYQILTKKLPFVDDNLVGLYYQIAQGNPERPCSHDKNIPKVLEDICLKAMDKYASCRYSSAKNLAEDLAKFCSGQQVHIRKLVLRKASIRSYELFASVRKFIISFMVLLAVFFGVLCYRSYNRPSPRLLNTIPPKTQKKRLLRQLNASNNQMRMTLARIYELNPTPLELAFIGRKALWYGHFQDAHNYLTQALKAIAQPKYAKYKNSVQKNIAQTLLYLGKLEESQQLYLQIQHKDAEVFIGLATVNYQQQKYQQALHYIDCIKLPQNIPPFFYVQKLLLQIAIAWENQRMELGRYHWLFSERRDCQQCQCLRKILNDNVAKKLQQAQLLIKSCRQNYLSNLLQQQIDVYTQGVKLELATLSQEQMQKQLQQKISNDSLAPKIQIFCTEVILRYLIRHGHWDKAYQLSNRACEKFPWATSLYMMRAIARFHRNDLRGLSEDTLKIIRMDRWNFLALENLALLCQQRFTLEEFKEYTNTLLHYFYRTTINLHREVLISYIRKLKDQSLHISKREKQITENTCRVMIQTLLSSKVSTIQRRLALQMLASHYQSRSVKQQLAIVHKQYPSVDTRQGKIIAELKKQMALYKKQQDLQELRQILVRYGAYYDERYSLQIYRRKQHMEPLLQEILQANDLPIIRLLAAQMLLMLDRGKNLQYLEKIATSKQYPANLFAAVALRLSAIEFPLPTVEAEMIFRKRKTKRQQTNARFCKLLLALYLNPRIDQKMYEQLAKKLLTNDDDLLVLCAAYNFRRYVHCLAPISSQTVQQQISQLAHSSKIEQVRTWAIRSLWRSDDLYQDAKSQHIRISLISQQICPNYWQNTTHRKVLLTALKAKSQQVQLVSLQSIIGDEYMRNYIHIYVDRDDKFLHQLIQQIKKLFHSSPSYAIKYWSALVFATLDKEKQIWELIDDRNIPTMIRYAIVLQRGFQKEVSPQIVIKLFYKLFAYLTLKDDSRFIQLLILSAGETFAFFDRVGSKAVDKRMMSLVSPYRELVRRKILPALNHPDIHVRRAVVAALLWIGAEKDIAIIYPYVKSVNPHMRRAAAATAAGLTAKFSPHQIPKLQQALQKLNNPEILRSAAFGYYSYFNNQIYYPIRALAGGNTGDTYKLYLLYLQRQAAQTKHKQLQNWLQAIKCATQLAPCAQYHYEQAVLLRQLKYFSQAQQQLQQALKLIENSDINYQRIRQLQLHCRLLQAQLAAARKQHQLTKNLLIELLEQFPFSPAPHLQLAKTYQQLGEIEQAKQSFWYSYLAKPLVPQPLFALAAILIQQGNVQQALDLDKYSCPLWNARSVRSLQTLNFKINMHNVVTKKPSLKLRHILQEGLSAWPFNSSFNIMLAENFVQSGEYAKALRYFCNSYLSNPQNSQPLIGIAHMFIRQKLTANALVVCRELHRKFAWQQSDFMKDPLLATLKKHLRNLPGN